MLHLKARQNPNQWMIAAPFKCHLKNSVQWGLQPFGEEQERTVALVPPRLWLCLSPCWLLCSLPVSSFPSARTWATWVGVCPGGWTMQEVSPTEVFPFGMSLFNFRVLLFLCEWNVRNEFHHVIFQALTGLCHLSLDHEFAFGFLPCLGFWPIPLSASNFTSQYSLWWRSRLPSVTCNFEA